MYKKHFASLALFLLLALTACNNSDEYQSTTAATPHETTTPPPSVTPTTIPTINNAPTTAPTTQIEEYNVEPPTSPEPPADNIAYTNESACQAAIDFLSGFTTIFQPHMGMRDKRTGNFYAWQEDLGWTNIDDVPPSEWPLVFQGGWFESVPDAHSGFSDTGDVFFGNGFYRADGSSITDVPFIRGLRDGIFHPADFYFGAMIASRFALYDFDDNGMPVIIVGFRQIGTRIDNGVAWGFSLVGSYVMYRFIDGAYREAGIVPSQPRGHFISLFPAFYMNDAGEKLIIIYEDGHYEGRIYTFQLTESGMELAHLFADPIEDEDFFIPWLWWDANRSYFRQIYPIDM
ncbi:MAG: hypothetical protein FWC71_01235 [Defluviitaleaceae bacterium]|nr:hypothetical protein [Defluviitaleaceae bacterium]